MIPKIIHQTWCRRELPAHFARWSAEWRRLHPDWQYILHDDADIIRTINDRAPQYRTTFEGLPRVIQRIDMFRYLIVWLDGGLYADLDMVPYQASDPLIEGESCVLGVEHRYREVRRAELEMKLPYQFQNCIFAAEPGHPFLFELLENISRVNGKQEFSDDDVEDTTGPRMLTRLAYSLPKERRGRIKVVPEINWAGPWQYPRIGPLKRQIYCRHAASGTWRKDRRSLIKRWRERAELANPLEKAGPMLP